MHGRVGGVRVDERVVEEGRVDGELSDSQVENALDSCGL